MRRIVSSPRFALADLFLVILGGCLWMLGPEIPVLPIITIALLPWVLRSVAGVFPFRRTSLDWLVLLFLVTAWVGYWAAYDQEAAWSKVWFIVLSVLLYYALAGQPAENREWICVLFFCIGLGVCIYFFLTHDFVAQPRKLEFVNRIGRWVMERSSRLGWTAIHPNYVAGIAALTAPLILYPALRPTEGTKTPSMIVRLLMAVGLVLVSFTVLMATSRGVIMAIVSAGGAWILWKVFERNAHRLWLRRSLIFPSLIILYLCSIVVFLYVGPASSGYISADYPYGTGSRAELFWRSLYLVGDFPFTGGGLGAFPGLYAYYILGIPFFNVINSHNLFLDVAIEQGLLGGLAFLTIFLLSIWFLARNIVRADSPRDQLFSQLTLGALIIAFVHGMVDDYLYNGSGTMFALALAGLSSSIRSRPMPSLDRKDRRIFSLVPLALITLIMLNMNGFQAAWFADLGAVQMAKVELAGFPTGQWTDPGTASKLEEANVTLRSSLHADPGNQTANHRLGLISLLRGDFLSASIYLENAYKAAPAHRGITKSLGYCYVWLGDMEKALVFLKDIPEAREELDVYVWWWGTQGRQDLSDNAFEQATYLKSQTDH